MLGVGREREKTTLESGDGRLEHAVRTVHLLVGMRGRGPSLDGLINAIVDTANTALRKSAEVPLTPRNTELGKALMAIIEDCNTAGQDRPREVLGHVEELTAKLVDDTATVSPFDILDQTTGR